MNDNFGDLFEGLEVFKKPPGEYIGVIVGKNKCELYCRRDGSECYVINGAWYFDIDTGLMYCREENQYLEFPIKIVLPNMEENLDYNYAVRLISEAAKNL